MRFLARASLNPVLRFAFLFFLSWGMLVTPVLSQEIPASTPPKPDAFLPPSIAITQGDVYFLKVAGPEGTRQVRGVFKGKTLPFFNISENRFGSLLGIDLAEPPSSLALEVEFLDGSRVLGRASSSVDVTEATFGTQALTLPKGMVDLDPKTLKRVNKEQGIIQSALEKSSADRIWSGRFILPVEGRIAGMFGFRRIMNGQARNPHSGEDIVVPLGTEVRATNRGVVRLVGDYFFNGKSIILDHGMGLETMYFHLQEASVREGETVERGQVIGRAGATGRATGPHLHWGARLLDSRVNPLSLVQQPLDEAAPETP